MKNQTETEGPTQKQVETLIASALAIQKRIEASTVSLSDAERQLSRRVDDTILHHQGECWWAATALYTALARIAQGNSEVEGALRPVVAFFALGSRKKAAPQAPPTSTPPAKSAA